MLVCRIAALLCHGCPPCNSPDKALGFERNVKYEVLFIIFLIVPKKVCIFATDLVTRRTDFFTCNSVMECSLSVKRESGANPEQSRCCELLWTQPSTAESHCR